MGRGQERLVLIQRGAKSPPGTSRRPKEDGGDYATTFIGFRTFFVKVCSHYVSPSLIAHDVCVC
jgi:hypothetical protein